MDNNLLYSFLSSCIRLVIIGIMFTFPNLLFVD